MGLLGKNSEQASQKANILYNVAMSGCAAGRFNVSNIKEN